MSAEPDITPEDGNDSISIEEGEHVQTVEGSEGLDVPPEFSVQEQANLKELTLLDKSLKGTGSPYKVTTMLLTALPFCFYHIRKRFP